MVGALCCRRGGRVMLVKEAVASPKTLGVWGKIKERRNERQSIDVPLLFPWVTNPLLLLPDLKRGTKRERNRRIFFQYLLFQFSILVQQSQSSFVRRRERKETR